MSTTKKMVNTLALIVLTFLARAYLAHLYGSLCGVSLFDWNTWGNVLRLDSPVCNALEWSIYHSKSFMVVTTTGLSAYVMGFFQKEVKENTV